MVMYFDPEDPQAFLKKGRLCASTGESGEASKLFRQALKYNRLHSGSREEMHSIKEAMDLLSSNWCAQSLLNFPKSAKRLYMQYWADCITAAEAPNPVSSRDGRMLRPVPASDRLTQPMLSKKLQEAVGKMHGMQAGLLCDAWSKGKRPDKAMLALMRGYAYAQAGKHEQSLKDAKVVLAYGPKEAAGSEGRCKWPWAHVLHAQALKGLQDMIGAALAMQTAHELDTECPQHREELDELKRYIPVQLSNILERAEVYNGVMIKLKMYDRATRLKGTSIKHLQFEHHSIIHFCPLQVSLEQLLSLNNNVLTLEVTTPVSLQDEGAAGLRQWLADEEERKKPEFLKQRPKYYYYYEWMKERICGQYPALPEPVMDKLLTMPAGDLDLILQHPKSTTWKVNELMDVLEDGGAAAVEGYPLQGLTWEQVKELKGPNLVGLGMGSGPAPGEGLIEQGLDRHEQLMMEDKARLLGTGNTSFLVGEGHQIGSSQEPGAAHPAWGLSGDLEALE